MGKYDPLHLYLRRKAANEIELTFRDIERIIGALLPKRATRPEWWSDATDVSAPQVQTRAWRDAGYDALPIRGTERVRFQRRQ